MGERQPTEHENLPQQVVDNLLTDPDKDAEGTPPPAPPQTIEAEPGARRGAGSDG